jgi:16S rRNA (guanine1207-N2)-methyltransferase
MPKRSRGAVPGLELEFRRRQDRADASAAAAFCGVAVHLRIPARGVVHPEAGGALAQPRLDAAVAGAPRTIAAILTVAAMSKTSLNGFDGVYGVVPDDLVAVGAKATQLSPLMPGAAALEDVADASLASIAVLAPPGTLERRYVLAQALRALVVDGAFAALAPRNRGGARLRGELAQFGFEVEETSKSHFRVCAGARPAVQSGLDAAITAGGPQFVAATGLWSQPGIFSWDRIDPGSHLLAEHLPRLSGKGADLGCGTGFLSRRVLASPDVQALALVDIDRRAIAAARRNVADSRANFHWLDAALPLPFGRALDFVVTNPPFHKEGSEDRALGLAVALQAARLLAPGGELWLVANRHLSYAPALRESFVQIALVAQDSEYHVYRAVRGR